MRIGIVSGCDIREFAAFFKEKEFKVLCENCKPNAGPAINTLLLSFLKAGHHVRIFTLTKEDFVLKGENIEIYGVRAFTGYPIKYLWGAFSNAKNVKRVVKKNIGDLDVLHAHWTYSYAYAAKDFSDKLPVFCTVRDWASYIWKVESYKNKITWSFRYVMNELVFRNKKLHFIANSPYIATLIQRKYQLEVPIIPNPIKQSFLTNKERVKPNNLELLCISTSNDKRKNIETLLKAFQKVIEKYPSARLSLIGNPFTEDSPKISDWKRKGWLHKVLLMGPIDHNRLINHLDKTCIFVTPSLEESFGNTLLEGMARKVPVIAGKNSGAVPYVLKQGKAGFLCDVSDVDDLAQTIIYVYKNQEKVNDVVNYAFKHLVENYLDKNVCDKHIQYYKLYQLDYKTGLGVGEK
ncbi:glycosyltransferase involved in cell wall biosynthesis [Flavobacteriaceae bacterium MAR_2009_75]|nr:glycosyltransferase involved in cell wall biosynthesis [Flavobacteriaceae bacterium MAR_2009_75]